MGSETHRGFLEAGVNNKCAVSPSMTLNPVKKVHGKKTNDKASTGNSARVEGLSRDEGEEVDEEDLFGDVIENEAGELIPREAREQDVENSRFMETENDEDEEEETTAAQVKIRAAPSEPSARERAEHEATHLPYRSWCVHCPRPRS